MVFARVNLTDYANRVLNVIKAQFSLKDKSEALNKFVELYGTDVVEQEATDQYVQRVLDTAERHVQKYKHKKMTLKELDSLCEAD